MLSLCLLFAAAIKQPFGIAKRCSFADALDSCPQLETLANAYSPIWESDEAARDARSNAITNDIRAVAVTQCSSKRDSISKVNSAVLIAEECRYGIRRKK